MALTDRRLEPDGFELWPAVFNPEEVRDLAASLDRALEGRTVMRSRGATYAARNLLEIFPESRMLWRRPPLVERLVETLGPECGLVRGLYFDKPPERTWGLPWHKDLTVAVKKNRLPSTEFDHPTTKEGIPHVEAPCSLLEAMLTLRIHLDDVTDENGPLKVIPGSHRTGKTLQFIPEDSLAVHAGAGDVLAIRPLTVHSSDPSREGTSRRRRILHLEFAATPHLPDGYDWQWFFPADHSGASSSRTHDEKQINRQSIRNAAAAKR